MSFELSQPCRSKLFQLWLQIFKGLRPKLCDGRLRKDNREQCCGTVINLIYYQEWFMIDKTKQQLKVVNQTYDCLFWIILFSLTGLDMEAYCCHRGKNIFEHYNVVT